MVAFNPILLRFLNASVFNISETELERLCILNSSSQTVKTVWSIGLYYWSFILGSPTI